jgi:radical SAM enzyme (TIGR01210 family)
VNVWQPHGAFRELERFPDGLMADVATLLLTNRECPWRCLMCDLWKTTSRERVPSGAIPAQIDAGLAELGWAGGFLNEFPAEARRPRIIKLYNGGSFFDAGAIPPQDYQAIAQRVASFERVVVECHPALVGTRTLAFREELDRAATDLGGPCPRLEVAMGLETVHPEVLARLNKRMTIEQFAAGARFLADHLIDLRVFILVKPPFLGEAEALTWAMRSIDFAVACEARVITLIPVRTGNGAMEEIARSGGFEPPRLATLEAAVAYGVGLRRRLVFADLWDLERFSRCDECFPARRQRLEEMNHTQGVPDPVTCTACSEREA